MAELTDWFRYWRKTFTKCSRIHKDSRAHRRAYAELSDCLDRVEAAVQNGELETAVLRAVQFMQRMHELERDMGLHVGDRKVPAGSHGDDAHDTGK